MKNQSQWLFEAKSSYFLLEYQRRIEKAEKLAVIKKYSVLEKLKELLPTLKPQLLDEDKKEIETLFSYYHDLQDSANSELSQEMIEPPLKKKRKTHTRLENQEGKVHKLKQQLNKLNENTWRYEKKNIVFLDETKQLEIMQKENAEKTEEKENRKKRYRERYETREKELSSYRDELQNEFALDFAVLLEEDVLSKSLDLLKQPRVLENSAENGQVISAIAFMVSDLMKQSNITTEPTVLSLVRKVLGKKSTEKWIEELMVALKATTGKKRGAVIDYQINSFVNALQQVKQYSELKRVTCFLSNTPVKAYFFSAPNNKVTSTSNTSTFSNNGFR